MPGGASGQQIWHRGCSLRACRYLKRRSVQPSAPPWTPSLFPARTNPPPTTEERLDQFCNALTDSGQTLTLVPARARRINERIARILGEPPAEPMDLDQDVEPSQLKAGRSQEAAGSGLLRTGRCPGTGR